MAATTAVSSTADVFNSAVDSSMFDSIAVAVPVWMASMACCTAAPDDFKDAPSTALTFSATEHVDLSTPVAYAPAPAVSSATAEIVIS